MKEPFPSNHLNELGTIDNVCFQRLIKELDLSDEIKDSIPYFTEFFIEGLPNDRANYYECVLIDCPLTGLPGDPMDIFRVPKECNRRKGRHVYTLQDKHLIRVVVISKNRIRYPICSVKVNSEVYA